MWRVALSCILVIGVVLLYTCPAFGYAGRRDHFTVAIDPRY